MTDADEQGDADDLQAIREAKKERLKARLGEGDTTQRSSGSIGDGPGDGPEEGPEDDPADGTAVPDPIHVDDQAHLAELTSTHDVLLVDFYADWCGPCKMLEPELEALHDQGTAVVATVDIDQHQDIAQRQNVRGVPTMVLYVDGDPVERLVGAKDRATLEATIRQHA